MVFLFCLWFPLLCKKLLSLIRSHLFIFVSVFITLEEGSKKTLLQLMSKGIQPMLSSRSFIVSGVTFGSLIHFEFIFVYDVREYSIFIILQDASQFSTYHLLQRLSFLHCIFLIPLSKINFPYVHWFISDLHILFQWSIFVFVPLPYCFDYCSFVV